MKCHRTLFLNATFLTATLALASPFAAQAENFPATNPFLSAPVYGVTHFNSGQTDTIPYSVPRGEFRVDLEKALKIPGGPINIMTLASTVPGFFWAISTDRVAYVDARDGGWTSVAEIGIPGATRRSVGDLDALLGQNASTLAELETRTKEILGPVPQTVTFAGLYTLVDNDNVAYMSSGNRIVAVGLRNPSNPADGLEVKRVYDAGGVLPPMDMGDGGGPSVRLIGINMTYDGHLILGSTNAVAVIDRFFQGTPSIHVIEDGQFMSNSFSVDDSNGIYVASGSFMPKGDGILRKLVWTGSKLSADEADGAWSSPYDGGNWPPAVKAGTGTGSTPSLMGFGANDDRLVVLTDGVDRMRLVAFWRDAIPEGFEQRPGTKSRRIAGQIQVTAGLPADVPWVQSEQSVVVNGTGAFVVNNVIAEGHSDKMIDVLAVGPLIKPPRGGERFEWDSAADAWRSLWTRGDVISTSMVPIASAPSGMVFVNGYTAEDGWEVTGMDWETGKTVHRTFLGKSGYGNGAYALLQFNEAGDLIFNSVGGPFRIPLSAAK